MFECFICLIKGHSWIGRDEHIPDKGWRWICRVCKRCGKYEKSNFNKTIYFFKGKGSWGPASTWGKDEEKSG